MMSQNATTTVYFQNTDGQALTDRFSDTANYRAKESEDRDAFTGEVSEGDYLAIVYQTPSNGGSLHRCMGTVSEVNHVNGRLDDLRFTVEKCDRDASSEGSAYLHLNPSTGDYHFQDAGEDAPADGWRVEKVAWTPEDGEGGDA